MKYEEIKNYLLENYGKYFEILDIELQTRIFQYEKNIENAEEILNKNLKNYIECEKITAENKSLYFNEINKAIYEKHLKIYNEIMNCK